MKEFANTYEFTLVTSSSHYAQSNGLAEQTILTVKALLQKSSDPYTASEQHSFHGVHLALQSYLWDKRLELTLPLLIIISC